MEKRRWSGDLQKDWTGPSIKLNSALRSFYTLLHTFRKFRPMINDHSDSCERSKETGRLWTGRKKDALRALFTPGERGTAWICKQLVFAFANTERKESSVEVNK
jgi:hypothetical protein